VKLSWRRRLGVYTGIGVLAVAVLSFGSGGTAYADQTISHTFAAVQCTAIVNGSPVAQSQDVTVGFLLPDSVAPNGTFTMTFPGGSALLPNSSNGLNITSYNSLSLAYQVKGGGSFVSGSIVNPGTATIVPTAAPHTPANTPETATISTITNTNDEFATGTPGPFVPGTLTTPTITVNVQAPASGAVTFNAFKLTTAVVLNGAIHTSVSCSIPTDTLATVPVVAGGSSTTTASSTSSSTESTTTTIGGGSTTTTTTGGGSSTSTEPSTSSTTASTTSTTASTTSTTASTTTSTEPATTSTEATTTTTEGPLGTTTSTLPPIEQVKIHGSASVVNNCISALRPAISLVPDTPSSVTVVIGSDADPQPHLGDPITLSKTTVTVKVPGDLLVQGYNFGIVTNGEVIPATLSLTINGSNTTEGTHTYPLIHSSPKVVIHDPDGVPGTKDETADPLSVTSSLPNTTWHPKDASKSVFFSEKSAIIKATVPIGDVNYTDTQTCNTPNAPAFVALSASGVEPPSTVGTQGSTAAATTTTVAVTAAATTLPRTGASVVLWLVIAAVMLDLGVVAVVGTRKRAHNYLHR